MHTELRTKEERIMAMHARAAELETQHTVKRARAISMISVGVSVAAVLILALMMPGITGKMMPITGEDLIVGSILSNTPFLGYLVIGTIAFMLGAAVTILCIRLNRLQDAGTRRSDID